MSYGSRGRVRGGYESETTRLPRTAVRAAPRGGATAHARAIEAIAFPLLVGVVHFLIVQGAASYAFRHGKPTSPSGPAGFVYPPLTGLAHTLVEPLRMWDGLWYKLIAEQGYAGGMEAKAAFWPLFPWLMSTIHRLTGITTDVAGYLIANVAFIVALMLLYRLVALDFDRAVARRTLWAIALFPVSLFFSAVYTESLFLMLAAGALLAARLRRWWLAGILGALGALTRSYGVLLLLPFAVLFLQQHRLAIRRWLPDAIPAAFPALGPAIFGFYLGLPIHNVTLRGLPVIGAFLRKQIWNDPLDFVHVQAQWARFSATPWETARCAVRGCSAFLKYPPPPAVHPVPGAQWGWLTTLLHHPTWSTLSNPDFRAIVANSNTLELVCTVLFLVLALFGLRYLPLYQSVYLIPGLLIPLFSPSAVHPLMSMPRFGLTLFPLFVMLALLFNSRKIAIPIALISTVLLIVFTVQFAQWYWVS